MRQPCRCISFRIHEPSAGGTVESHGGANPFNDSFDLRLDEPGLGRPLLSRFHSAGVQIARLDAAWLDLPAKGSRSHGSAL